MAYDNFDSWYEDVDNIVYAYFGEGLSDLEDLYRIDLNYFFEAGENPKNIISILQNIIEDEEYRDD